MEDYYPCCGKSICKGCVHSLDQSGNASKCPCCNSDRGIKKDETVEELSVWVEANDPGAICMLAFCYNHGLKGLQQDHSRAVELYARAADLGYNDAHFGLGDIYREGGNLKKAKFHFEAAAMAGDESARCIIGYMEEVAGNVEHAVKHWTIAASVGCYDAMHEMRRFFEKGKVSRESIDATLSAYNNSCAEFRSEARDACIRAMLETD